MKGRERGGGASVDEQRDSTRPLLALSPHSARQPVFGPLLPTMSAPYKQCVSPVPLPGRGYPVDGHFPFLSA